jgi:hypothetical protein
VYQPARRGFSLSLNASATAPPTSRTRAGAGGSGRYRPPADWTSSASLEKPKHGSASKRSSSSTHRTEARRPGPTRVQIAKVSRQRTASQ